jgi:hypothetical protein
MRLGYLSLTTNFTKNYKMRSLIILLAVISALSVAQQSNNDISYPMATLTPTAVLHLVDLDRVSTTFMHGPSQTTCPCYEPSKSDCGIAAFSRIVKTRGSCPVPWDQRCAIPWCHMPVMTRYRDRCPQQVFETTMQESPCRTTVCEGCPELRTTVLEGIGPVQRVMATSV